MLASPAPSEPDQDRPEPSLRVLSARLSRPWWDLLRGGSTYLTKELRGALRDNREAELKTARRLPGLFGAEERSIIKVPVEGRGAIVARFYRSVMSIVEPCGIERARAFADEAIALCRAYDGAEVIATPSFLQVFFPVSPPPRDALAAVEALLPALENISPTLSQAKRSYGGYRSVKDGPPVAASRGTLERVTARAEALWSAFPELPARISYG